MSIKLFTFNEYTVELVIDTRIKVSLYNLHSRFENYVQPSEDTLTETLDDLYELLESIFTGKLSSNFSIEKGAVKLTNGKIDLDSIDTFMTIQTKIPYGIRRTKEITFTFPEIFLDKSEVLENRVLSLEKTVAELKDKLRRQDELMIERIGYVTEYRFPLRVQTIYIECHKGHSIKYSLYGNTPYYYKVKAIDHGHGQLTYYSPVDPKETVSLKDIQYLKYLTTLTIPSIAYSRQFTDYEYIGEVKTLTKLKFSHPTTISINIAASEKEAELMLDLVVRLPKLTTIGGLYFDSGKNASDYLMKINSLTGDRDLTLTYYNTDDPGKTQTLILSGGSISK